MGDVDSGTFSVAAVIAARPDLAILAAWQFNALGEGVQQIEAAGIPVVAIDCNAQTVATHPVSAPRAAGAGGDGSGSSLRRPRCRSRSSSGCSEAC
ncbi:hypothetical protein LV780_19260 [Cereibacter azotoformans]|uniref:hypothetical protein n=1 Tax=Cereibacter azotoformans TaxID=43057 RepID=UPI0011C170E1|nr:hypothetical protein [Cereibacter azotoformans]UIJ32441.1 hypothetical protein LV780_19260 [Cereibacter azotoformans]